jgi:hypothetical protein
MKNLFKKAVPILKRLTIIPIGCVFLFIVAGYWITTGKDFSNTNIFKKYTKWIK